MSFTTARRRAMLACAAAFAATAVLSGPAAADDSTATGGCPVVPTVQPFTPWQDAADYFLAPDGGVEAGGAGWDVQGGATAVEGNEPFFVGGPADRMSMHLPTGAAATTAPVCVGIEHRTMRFFARGTGAGVLQVDAVYAKRTDREKSVQLGTIVADGTWAPSPVLPMRVNEIAPDFDNALPVSLRFVARGEGAWQIDDVYVDPYRRG
ncbi:MAG: hypothetical protein ACLGI5_13715 [Thermoleophilia bacterium]